MTFEKRLAERYGDLSDALRLAADYLADNPVDVATRTLRSVSRESSISPAAFSRLARALDYADFEELREELRGKIGRQVRNFADRAQQLHDAHHQDPNQTSFFDAHLAACQANLQDFAQTIDRAGLDAAVDQIVKARRVILQGALGSTGVMEYMSYMASFCADNWTMASRMGSSLASGLIGLGEGDVMIIVTKPPFAQRAIVSARMAQEQGVYVVLITDTHVCPALKYASQSFIIPTDSPNFYSSYVVTVFLVEALIGVLVSRTGASARTRISKVEEANKLLAEVWDS